MGRISRLDEAEGEAKWPAAPFEQHVVSHARRHLVYMVERHGSSRKDGAMLTRNA